MLLKQKIVKGYLKEAKAIWSDFIPEGQIGWVCKVGVCDWIYPRHQPDMLEELKRWAR